MKLLHKTNFDHYGRYVNVDCPFLFQDLPRTVGIIDIVKLMQDSTYERFSVYLVSGTRDYEIQFEYNIVDSLLTLRCKEECIDDMQLTYKLTSYKCSKFDMISEAMTLVKKHLSKGIVSAHYILRDTNIYEEGNERLHFKYKGIIKLQKDYYLQSISVNSRYSQASCIDGSFIVKVSIKTMGEIEDTVTIELAARKGVLILQSTTDNVDRARMYPNFTNNVGLYKDVVSIHDIAAAAAVILPAYKPPLDMNILPSDWDDEDKERLFILLKLAKQEEFTPTFEAVQEAFKDMYCDNMPLTSVCRHISKALIMVINEKRFQTSANAGEGLFNVIDSLAHPFYQNDVTYTSETLRKAFITNTLITLRNTNIGWMRMYLYPEKKIDINYD